MAFNKWAYFTIKPGETFFIHYWFTGGPPNAECGDDHGAQYCMADPEAGSGILWVHKQGKERISVPTPHGTSGFIYFRYHVIVEYQAVENRSLDFTIQGGGVV
jgi:hypothetical protein